ncbi:MAG: M24 family metallopeptidase, partial [Acidobacteriota bacterium]
MQDKKLDVIAIYGDAAQSANLSYLTNFFPYSDTGIFVLTSSRKVKLFTTHAYRNIPWFNTITWLKDIVCTNNIGKDLTNYLLSLDLEHGRVGLVYTSSFPYPIYKSLKEKIGASIHDMTREFEDMRVEKSETELKFTDEAAKIAVESFKRLNEVFIPGKTGYELAAEIELVARQHKAQDLFFTLQPNNSNSVLTQPTSKSLNQVCSAEICVEYLGYWAKLGRTFFSKNLSNDYKKRNKKFLLRAKRISSKVHIGQTLREHTNNIRNHLSKINGVKKVDVCLAPGLDPYWSSHLNDDIIVRKNMIFYTKIDLVFVDNLRLTATDTYTTQHKAPMLLT